MNNAVLYNKSNSYQQNDSQQALEEFAHLLKWRLDGEDSVLDAGCGTGNITADVLLPLLPPNFKRLVGVDISQQMVNYAREKYLQPKLEFDVFDLAIELEKQPLNGIEPFDHIFSFYCLMWVHDQKTCLQNFYKLLKPGGDMLLVLLVKSALYDFYKEQSRNSRWAEYMTDVDEKITPYQYSPNAADEFHNLLSDCGFTECDVKVLDKHFIFNGVESVRNCLQSVNPFIDRIPGPDKQAVIDDLINRFVEGNHVLDDFNEDSKTCRFQHSYKLLVGYARK